MIYNLHCWHRDGRIFYCCFCGFETNGIVGTTEQIKVCLETGHGPYMEEYLQANENVYGGKECPKR